jgi:predicted nucleic acid-binding protein
VVAGLPDEVTIIALARRHRLTVYDDAYLELALREALPLATLDKALADAAQAESVSLVGHATR